MKIEEMHWQQVEDYLRRDDRCILPLGSTEQHAYLSLATDNILAYRVAVEAAEPLGIPVFPPLNYGITPYFRAYPGSISLRVETYLHVVRDILDGLAENGFRRIVIVNGHGGNSPAAALANEWLTDHPGLRIRFHDWWRATKTWAKVMDTDPVASHASWMENFPWTRLAGVAQPQVQKPPADSDYIKTLASQQTRAYLGDGNYAGYYERPDAEMLAIWQVAIEETRAVIEHGWEQPK